jgi:hypothetical protein
MNELHTLNQRVRGSSPWRRTTWPGRRFAGPSTRPDHEDVGGLPVSQLAPEVAVLGHADLGVAELIADLAGGHVGIVEKARDGLAGHVADEAVHLRLVSALAPHAPHVRRIAPAAFTRFLGTPCTPCSTQVSRRRPSHTRRVAEDSRRPLSTPSPVRGLGSNSTVGRFSRAIVTRVSTTHETSLDMAFIEHFASIAAPFLFPSGWVVEISTHYLGGGRHFGDWPDFLDGGRLRISAFWCCSVRADDWSDLRLLSYSVARSIRGPARADPACCARPGGCARAGRPGGR